MKAYKGFDKDLKCKGFQYEIGKTYEIPENEVSICNNGFHACKSPLEVWDYYGIVNGNRFCEVESDGKIESEENNTKICSSKITVKAEIGIKGLVHAMVDFVRESVKDCKSNMESGYYVKIDSSGEDSVICCAGDESIVRAKKGSWITLSEWEYSEEKNRYIPVCVKAEYVDGERIKADTWYKLENGKFMEVEE